MPTSRANRSVGGNRARSDRSVRVARAARAASEARAYTEELGAARRGEVYQTDVEFTPETHVERDPRWGSSERWVAPIRELYGRGLSQLEVANELNLSQGYVSILVRKYGIVKGKREK